MEYHLIRRPNQIYYDLINCVPWSMQVLGLLGRELVAPRLSVELAIASLIQQGHLQSTPAVNPSD